MHESITLCSKKVAKLVGENEPPTEAPSWSFYSSAVQAKHVGLRDGRGEVLIRHIAFDERRLPMRFVVFTIPPGCSEGSHTHFADDRNATGSYLEIYYIVSGSGRMTVGDDARSVSPGDCLLVPLDVARGIENTHSSVDLVVHLTVASS